MVGLKAKNRYQRSRKCNIYIKSLKDFISKEVEKGNQLGAWFCVEGQLITHGDPVGCQVLIENEDLIQSGLASITADNISETSEEQFTLPEPPNDLDVIQFKDARNLLMKCMRIITGRRPSYKADSKDKPSWWNLEWKSPCSSGFKKADTIELLKSMYLHYGMDINSAANSISAHSDET